MFLAAAVLVWSAVHGYSQRQEAERKVARHKVASRANAVNLRFTELRRALEVYAEGQGARLPTHPRASMRARLLFSATRSSCTVRVN
jgi:serine phosphatase RsbU (regulator of sigma subunit)